MSPHAMNRDASKAGAIAPMHDPVPPARTRPHLYFVGEAERSTRAPAAPAGRTMIQINGQWHAMRGRTVTLEQILGLAFPQRALQTPLAATVSFRGGIGTRPCGLISPGDVIEIADDLRINADATYAS